MGAVVQAIGSLFGATSYDEPETPEYQPTPVVEESKDPVSKSVRDAEQRKLRQRRYMSGTVLTSPLGVNGAGSSSGLLGDNNK